MQLGLSDAQVLLQDTVRRLFEAECTPARLRAAEASGFDAGLWDKLVDLGIPAMRAAGMSLLDAAVVAEESGRRVAPIALIEAIVAVSLLGEREGIATIALCPIAEAPVQLVPGGAVANWIVAFDGETLVAIRPAGVERARDVAASAAALIDLREGEREVLAGGIAAYQAAIEEWHLLGAAVQIGIAHRAIHDAAAWSCEREQFGQPLGVFQAIAHPLADSITDVESARLLVHHAIWAVETGDDQAAALIRMAHWWAGEAADTAIRRSLRTLGGMGLSMEGEMQLLYRRAKLSRMIAGNPADELEVIAARLWAKKNEEVERPALPQTEPTGLDFSYGAKAEAYAIELRAFVEAHLTPEIEARKDHTTESHDPAFHKAMAAAGHAFPSFDYPGQIKRDRYEIMAAAPLWEDIGWSRTSISITEFNANMCALWGTDEAKGEILPRIVRGEALGCLGFSEPGAGSDVFGCAFKAERQADGDWLMNGQKLWTTGAHNADYILMLTRTTAGLKKHQGLTMFLMPLNEPGFTMQPIKALNGERVNACFWSDVRIPDRYRLGEVDQGVQVMISALGFEQGGAGYWAVHKAMLKHAVSWANRSGEISRPAVRAALASVAVHEKAADLLCRREIWAEMEGCANPAYGPMAKLFTTEWLERDAASIVEVAAPLSLIKGSDPDLDTMELYMRRGLASTIHGGTSEVHRSLIAEKLLEMPKSR
jgi:alkylation response protein AidB-like acyl-CoA dehydrogenase